MAVDNLTYALIIIAITLAIVSLMLALNNRKTERKLRSVSMHMDLLAHSEIARELCRRIRARYPELCAGIDYTLKEDGDSVAIDEWNNDKPRP